MLPLVIDAIEFSRACLVAARNSQLSSAAFSIAIAVSLIYLISTLCVLLNYYVLKRGCRPTKSYLYYGRVAHARVKGGAVHKFSYPLFLAYLDLEEMARFESFWFWWPIFKVNKTRRHWGMTFCSFDYHHFMKKAIRDSNSTSESLFSVTLRFYEQCLDSVSSKTAPRAATTPRRRSSSRARRTDKPTGSPTSVKILSHLTYFGYCFNPVSFYYLINRRTSDAISGGGRQRSNSGGGRKKTTESIPSISGTDRDVDVADIDGLFIEVNNTPWIEQHPYFIHRSAPEVQVVSDNGCYDCTFNKDFHVSPFMEMDYKYNFKFSAPGESLWVRAQNIKLSTGEIWFQANVELERIAFTPLNLLYVLLYYPLHTRLVQVWIHVEAVKLFWKGVALRPHPQDADVDFFMGVLTAKNLLYMFDTLLGYPFKLAYNSVFASPRALKATAGKDAAAIDTSARRSSRRQLASNIK